MPPLADAGVARGSYARSGFITVLTILNRIRKELRNGGIAYGLLDSCKRHISFFQCNTPGSLNYEPMPCHCYF